MDRLRGVGYASTGHASCGSGTGGAEWPENQGGAVYSIEQQGILRRKARLVAQKRLSERDFADIAKTLRKRPKKARKVGMVAARKAARTERIETRWNGKESSNTAEAG